MTKSTGVRGIKLPSGPNSKCWKGGKYVSLRKFSHWRRNANTRKLCFEITIADAEEILEKQNHRCALTGLPLTFPETQYCTDYTASIDRKDSTKGYTKDNCQFVTKDINRAKGVLTDEDFIALCQRVANHTLEHRCPKS